jgi:hypothetical protein
MDICTNKLMCFYTICQCQLEFQKAKGPSFLLWVTFLLSKISIALQGMQTSSILNQVVTIGLVTSRLPPFKDTPPITTINYYKWSIIGDILTCIICVDMTSFKFFFFSPIHLYIFQIHGGFIMIICKLL